MNGVASNGATPVRSVGRPHRRPRVGLVIGSGGIKCAAALGLWKVLEREGIEVDVVVGCSGGSIFAAAYAFGMRAADAETMTLRLWGRLFRRVHLRSLLRIGLPRLFRFSERVGLLDDRRFWAALRETYGEATFADCRTPLFIAASDLRTTDKVTIAEGRLSDAVRASSALPLLLRPWPVGDRLLIDGGTSNPLPIDVAIREGCDVILAMGFESVPHDTFPSFRNVVEQTMSLTMNHLIRSTFAFYSAAHHAEILPIMPDFGGRIGLRDVHRLPDIIAAGERAAESTLPYLQRLLATSAR